MDRLYRVFGENCSKPMPELSRSNKNGKLESWPEVILSCALSFRSYSSLTGGV